MSLTRSAAQPPDTLCKKTTDGSPQKSIIQIKNRTPPTPFAYHPCCTTTQPVHLARLGDEHPSQKVGQQITDGDNALAPCLFVHHDDSLEPIVRELLEYGLVAGHSEEQQSGRERKHDKRILSPYTYFTW